MNKQHIILIIIMELSKDKAFNTLWYTRSARQQDALKRRLERALADAEKEVPSATA